MSESLESAVALFPCREFGDITIVDVAGNLSHDEADRLLDTVICLRSRSRRPGGIALNMQNVRTVNSLGLGEIVRVFTWAGKIKVKFAIVQPTKKFRDVLAITKLLTVLDTYDTEAELLESWKELT
jgi:anti-anti-sigma factor